MSDLSPENVAFLEIVGEVAEPVDAPAVVAPVVEAPVVEAPVVEAPVVEEAK
jgi:hypothetical protein